MPGSVNPKLEIYQKGTWHHTAISVMVVLTPILGLLTIAVAVIAVVKGLPNGKALVLGLAAAWGILAPCWFFFDYFFIYKKVAVEDTWELFKHGQQVSIAIWAGLTLSLGALGTSDYLKGGKEELKCELKAWHAPPQTEVSLRVVCK